MKIRVLPRILITLLIFSFLLRGQFSGVAVAQAGLKVWPTRIEVTLGLGQQEKVTINLENESDNDITIQTYAMDFSRSEDGEYIFTEPEHDSYSAGKWLEISSPRIEIAGRESAEVPLQINVPQQVEPGGHYAVVFFEIPSGQPKEGIGVSARMATLFYITVPGATGESVHTNVDIEGLMLPGMGGGGKEIGVRILNTGNVHALVAAKAYLRSWGKTSELDLGQATVLPGGGAVLSNLWNEAPFLGKVDAEVVIGYFDGDGNLVQKSEHGSFPVVPWSLVGGIILLLVVFGAAWHYRRRIHLRSPFEIR